MSDDKPNVWMGPMPDNWVTRAFLPEKFAASDYQQQFVVGWDLGSDEHEARYDPKTGTFKVIGPVEIEKRRRWYEMRARIDAKFAAENPGWGRKG